MKAHKVIEAFLDDMIKQRLKDYAENNNSQGKLFIDQLLSNQDIFTSKVIMKSHFMDHISTYELITANVSNAILMLAIHSQVQEKLYNELVEILGDNFDFDNRELISKCEYLDKVARENLRLFPIVPIILRESSENFEIEPDVEIPKGIVFIINFFALHRNKKYWGEDADKFNPERFSKELSEDRHTGSYLPFSTGLRNCIAYKFSKEITKLILIRLVLNFKFTTSLKMEEIKLKALFTLKLLGPHLVAIENRK